MDKIVAKEGYVLALKDKSAVYEKVIYLGIYDNKDNYIEITEQEAKEIKDKLQKEMLVEVKYDKS